MFIFQFLLLLPPTLRCFSKFPFPQTASSLTRAFSQSTSMSINLHSHAFSGNPLLSKFPLPGNPLSPSAALEALNARISLNNTHSSPSPSFKVLPFRNGRPLASSSAGTGDSPPIWDLGWLGLDDLRGIFENSGAQLSVDLLVYLNSSSEDDAVYWAIDVSDKVPELGSNNAAGLCFVELRTLMVATDWSDLQLMGNLAIAGHVVIMLVIDRENDRALLAKRPMRIARLYTCLSGFTEPGESLEEAVRRETWEETGIEVGEVVYHSSQPWPVAPNSIPCQLMVGFFAYAKSLEITVDKTELEDAQWFSREDVRKALTFAKYKQAQRTAAEKVEQMCKGLEKNRSLASDLNVESADEQHASIVVPGPFAIAYHLISSWAFSDQNVVNGVECNSKNPSDL
ncbi:nudix hydrolase 19, chloroplastic-like isoform X2 [Glycine soja]|uniref:nudix hydrolase 19, chloroplastic-like isoform X2 n=1 Tax=Glycine soja TaxID=3848 RepID=UPI001039306F|nr:nudix hydrolase 19, chloroplastic-like isoform X2 [Glycine soja]XP_040867096.1 nudix hydrolase 19, chloroplastic isoform X2 [Glycine max]